MNEIDKLKGYFSKYPFMQNIHFCEGILKVSQSTLKMWLAGKRPLAQDIVDRIYPLIENLDNIFIGFHSK